jgi:hypothetical protein
MAAGISLSMGLQGQEIFASPKRQAWLWNLASVLFIGYQPVAVFSGLKRLGRETGHLVSRLRMIGTVSPLPHTSIRACTGTSLFLYF